MFLPVDADEYRTAKHIINHALVKYGYKVLGWRDVPRDSTACGPSAHRVEPIMEQLFLAPTGEAVFGHLELERQVQSILECWGGVGRVYIFGKGEYKTCMCVGECRERT